MIKEHLLDSAKAISLFKENLALVNELADAVLELLQEKPGSFYAFLPDNVPYEKIHDFLAGGKTNSLRKEVGVKLTNIINSNTSFSCIFDDFNSDIDNVDQNDLYQSHGMHYQGKVYYQVNCGVSRDMVLKCLNYSSTIWHSLCIVFRNDLECRREMDQAYIQMICKNAVFIMVEAYDSESYIYWCDAEGAEILKNT